MNANDLLIATRSNPPLEGGSAPLHESSTWGGIPSLIDFLLAQQQQLTAVERFALSAEHSTIPEQAQYYSRLLPASPPGPGQQYAFEVDLDRCSGCKACVTACHSLNGLSDRETWRDVGLLIGGTERAPVMQHVTAACHHCLEPGCMIACPVNAYEKDPITGIVKHLDDQCFGCQYCTLACPYNVPKYHAAKGIVRKCDMCSHRLSTGEAPACVQACPHEAISIRVVDKSDIIENAEVDHFLPGAPEPSLTLPTTNYKSKRTFPRNTLPADYYSISPQHPHWPLIIMLVLTQLSVGAFVTGSLLEQTLGTGLAQVFRPFHASSALLLGLLALGASTLHLGRPHLAFRGILGFRHSWLSREILAFGLFAGLAVPYAGVCWLASSPDPGASGWTGTLIGLLHTLGWAVAGTGILGVFCSAMIYAFTRRDLWSLPRTGLRFALTTALSGVATVWLSLGVMGFFADNSQLVRSLTRPLAESLILFSSLKLTYDALILSHLAVRRHTPLKRSALLMTGVLGRYGVVRIIAGLVGGVFIPLWMLNSLKQPAVGDWAYLVPVAGLWLGCLIGELFERYLFFAAVSAPRMPGGVRS